MLHIEEYQKCDCGAITIFFEDGASNACKQDNLESCLGISMDDLKDTARALPKSYCCNHCINHYGLDICACGSGESSETCSEGYEECGNPMEVLGISVPFKPKF